MKTGLPLMPAITPVLSRGPPSSRQSTRLCLGPSAFSMHPEDLDPELLDAGSLEDGAADPGHPGLDVGEGEDLGGGSCGRGKDSEGEGERSGTRHLLVILAATRGRRTERLTLRGARR